MSLPGHGRQRQKSALPPRYPDCTICDSSARELRSLRLGQAQACPTSAVSQIRMSTGPPDAFNLSTRAHAPRAATDCTILACAWTNLSLVLEERSERDRAEPFCEAGLEGRGKAALEIPFPRPALPRPASDTSPVTTCWKPPGKRILSCLEAMQPICLRVRWSRALETFPHGIAPAEACPTQRQPGAHSAFCLLHSDFCIPNPAGVLSARRR